MKNKKFYWISAFLMMFLGLAACKDDNAEPEPEPTTIDDLEIKEYVHLVMKEFYLWSDKMPQDIKPSTFANVDQLLDRLLFKPLDRWTFIRKDDGALLQELTEGRRGGYGFSIGWDQQGDLRVVFVFPNAPAGLAGLKRGNKILKINGQPVVTGQGINLGQSSVLEILDNQGQTKQISMQAREFITEAVVHSEVIDVDGKKAGYISYVSFDRPSEPVLDSIFTAFKSQNVSDLIIDLRYNPGGFVSSAVHLGSLMAPPSAVGKPFISEVFNSKNVHRNQVENFKEKANNINPGKLVFLTTRSSSSASEVIINSMYPFRDVVQLGSQTSGKFVGSFVLVHQGHTFAPIVFQSNNALNNTFEEGLKPDYTVPDDFTRDFGDRNENMLSEAIHYLRTGSFSGRFQGARLDLNEQPVFSPDGTQGPILLDDLHSPVGLDMPIR